MEKKVFNKEKADNFNRKWANIARQDSINRHLL